MPKSKSRIGILLPHSTRGGYFQLSLSIADSLLKHCHKYDYSLLVYDAAMLKWIANLNEHVGIVPVQQRSFRHRAGTFVNVLLARHVLPASDKAQASRLCDAHIDLLIVPFPGLFGFMENMPFVAVIGDVMSRRYPSPRYLTLRNRFQAMIVHRFAAKYSVLSVADSPQGMEDLHEYFKIPKEKIRVVPHVPPDYIYRNQHMDRKTADKLLSKYNLPEEFLFYPSELCRDKNHVTLLQALNILRRRYGVSIPLILAGGPGDSYKEIMQTIAESALHDQVTYLGFVTGEEIVALYKRAAALAFASICGPTSIPPLEAMILGTPVLCPNIFSNPAQVGDAAVLFDPFSVDDTAEKIYAVWRDRNLRGTLRQKGYERIQGITQEQYAVQWERVIEDALHTVKNSRDWAQ